MTANERVTALLVQDAETAEQLRTLLEGQGYRVLQASTTEKALLAAATESVDLVILEGELPGVNGLELVRQLRQGVHTRGIKILMLSSNQDVGYKVAGYEAGIDDYVTKPFLPVELAHRVRILSTQQGSRPKPEAPAARRGKIIALFGTKGGVGRTTIGVNLAVELKRLSRSSSVALVDADFFFGDTALHLNLSPAHTIIDLVERVDHLDADLLEQVLIPHSSGVRVLLSPRNPEDVETIMPEHLNRILDLVTACYDYVVVDCQSIYDERTLVILEKADEILLVIKPEVGCVKNMAVFSEMAAKLGLSFDTKIHIVLNRAGSKSGIGLQEIERIFRRQIAYQIPSAGNSVVVSVNRGIPLIIEHPNHPFSAQIARMGEHFVRNGANPGAPKKIPSTKIERSVS